MMDEKKRILFVDDEQNVLDGLRRMLRSMRNEWEMNFVDSGEKALEQMAEQSCHVIVSDMRMPGMSGEQLLSKVREVFPATARIVLSGQADKDDILKSVGPIHQFLQKPCNADTLISTINRICRLDNLFADEELKAMVTELESLPSLPALQEELITKLQTPDISPKMIGETISRDVGMTAKILQLVNSAFFGLRRHIATPAEAVSLLGLDTVRSLVITMHLFSQVSNREVKGFSQDALLTHSSEVAVIARKIAAAQGMEKNEIEDTYMAGLLHDVGKLVFAAQRPQQFAEARELMQEEKISFIEAERQTIGASHTEIGGYLLGLWGFAPAIVEAAIYHHEPCLSQDQEFSTLAAVHVANALAHGDASTGDDASEIDIDMNYLEKIDLQDQISAWQKSFARAA